MVRVARGLRGREDGALPHQDQDLHEPEADQREGLFWIQQKYGTSSLTSRQDF